MESAGDQLQLLLGHPSHLGSVGLNGPTQDFSFSFFTTSKPRNKYLMHSNLKTFNTIKLYKSWTIFWRFLLIFSFFWIQIQIWNLAPIVTARYRYRTPAVTTVTAVYRAVTNGKKNLVIKKVANGYQRLPHVTWNKVWFRLVIKKKVARSKARAAGKRSVRENSTQHWPF
jgi:hypothetical protein